MDNKIHIWELPEKTNSIDKDKDYTIVHDGTNLKRVNFNRIYNYFNQDYKIENTVKYFEVLLETEGKRYESLYSELELALDKYNETIEDLSIKFSNNRNKIRECEFIQNQMDNDINSLSKSFESIKNDFSTISTDLNDMSNNISNLKSNNDEIDSTISSLYYYTDSIESDIPKIKEDHEYIINTSNIISSNIKKEVNDNSEILTKNINDVYDKIVAIIDHYHHIKG